jgi:hypothetical protein
MSYTSIGREDFCPVGTILAYIGSSTDDPPGWVIANGSERTNGGSDLRYSGLRGLSIGSGTDASYTPPNLQAMFLRGIGSQTFSNIQYTGSTYKSTVSHQLLQHTHTTPALSAHGHTQNRTATGGSSGTNLFGLGAVTTSSTGSVTSSTATDTESYEVNLKEVIGLIIKPATPTVTVTGVDQATTETRPFNYGVVWIIKL